MRLVLYFLLAIFSIAVNAQPVESQVERQAREMALKIIWGDVVLPLNLIQAPNIFSGDVEIQMEDVEKMVNQPLYFERFGKPFYVSNLRATLTSPLGPMGLRFEEVDLVFTEVADVTDGTTKSQVSVARGDNKEVIEGELYKGYILPPRMVANLMDRIRQGDAFTFLTGARETGIVMRESKINIYSPYALFKPRFTVQKTSPGHDNAASWQTAKVSRHQLQYVRYDPNDSTTAKVLKVYSDPEKYKTIAIPGFKSEYRFWDDAEYTVHPRHVGSIDTLRKEEVLVPFTVHDIFVDPRDSWVLEWGTINARQDFIFIEPDEFTKASKNSIFLVNRDKKYPVVQVLVSVAPSDEPGPVNQYILDGRYPEQWGDLFSSRPLNTSFYFEDIMVELEPGKLARMWLPFVICAW